MRGPTGKPSSAFDLAYPRFQRTYPRAMSLYRSVGYRSAHPSLSLLLVPGITVSSRLALQVSRSSTDSFSTWRRTDYIYPIVTLRSICDFHQPMGSLPEACRYRFL